MLWPRKETPRPELKRGAVSIGVAGRSESSAIFFRLILKAVEVGIADRLFQETPFLGFQAKPNSNSIRVMADAKFNLLQDLLRSYGSCLVAYSGGVDSAFLAKVAYDVLGEKSLAVIADSFSLPRRELEEALQLAGEFGFPVRVIKTREFENADYLSNPANRCYFCKHELFSELEPLAREEGLAVIAYGENASDVGDFRPGANAAKEFKVCAPLKEAGLTKQNIRDLSASLGLPTAEKPQMACLSSRIPYGEPVTPEKLRMIESAENALKDLGFYDVRVRHHEIGISASVKIAFSSSSNPAGPSLSRGGSPVTRHLARIEIGPNEISKLFDDERYIKIAETLKALGYQHVTLDLLGYRRGSLNTDLMVKTP